MRIKFFLKGEGQGAFRGWVDFLFLHITILFYQVMIKTYISYFIVVYVIYFTHSLYCYVLMHFSLLLKNNNFLQEIHLLPQFLT